MDKMTHRANKHGLSDIESVRIDERAATQPAKFILANLIDDSSKSKLVLRSSGAEYHMGIYAELKREVGDKLQVNVKGGGKLQMDQDNKTIRLWGVSSEYGLPDYEKVKELLHGKYPEFKINIG